MVEKAGLLAHEVASPIVSTIQKRERWAMMLTIFFGILPGFLAYGRHHAYGMVSVTFRVGPPSSYPHKHTQKQVA